MPVQIKYTEDNSGVVTQAVGKVTLDDILESSRQIFSHKNFKGLQYWMMLRDSDSECEVTIPDMKKVFQLHNDAAKINPELAIALIPHSAKQHIMDLIYDSHMKLFGGFNSNIFGGQQSAQQWIDETLSDPDTGEAADHTGLNHPHKLNAWIS